MTAICKKEVKSYLTSMTGYVFIAFILLLAGVYFTAYNLQMGYPVFGYTLSAITFVFLIITPILTMRVLAEEKKQKTDQLLLTSPLSVKDIVLGKFTALIVIFLIPMIILCIYPIILKNFGSVSLKMAYVAVIGFFLLGCANIGIDLLCSTQMFSDYNNHCSRIYISKSTISFSRICYSYIMNYRYSIIVVILARDNSQKGQD